MYNGNANTDTFSNISILTDLRSNKYSGKIKDTRHIHLHP